MLHSCVVFFIGGDGFTVPWRAQTRTCARTHPPSSSWHDLNNMCRGPVLLPRKRCSFADSHVASQQPWTLTDVCYITGDCRSLRCNTHTSITSPQHTHTEQKHTTHIHRHAAWCLSCGITRYQVAFAICTLCHWLFTLNHWVKSRGGNIYLLRSWKKPFHNSGVLAVSGQVWLFIVLLVNRGKSIKCNVPRDFCWGTQQCLAVVSSQYRSLNSLI